MYTLLSVVTVLIIAGTQVIWSKELKNIMVLLLELDIQGHEGRLN